MSQEFIADKPLPVESVEAALPVETGSDIFRLELIGRTYSIAAPALEARMRQAVDLGARVIILDCGALEAIDSSALSAVIEGFKAIKAKRDGKVIFASPSPAIIRILQLTKMEKFFPIVATLAEAMELVRTP